MLHSALYRKINFSFLPFFLFFFFFGGDVAVSVLDITLPSLPTPFYSVLVSVSVFMAPSTVFHSINSPNNSPLSQSLLPVLFLPYWSFQLYVSS